MREYSRLYYGKQSSNYHWLRWEKTSDGDVLLVNTKGNSTIPYLFTNDITHLEAETLVGIKH